MWRIALLAMAACSHGEASAADAAPTPLDTTSTIDGISCPVEPCTILPQCGCGEQQACDVVPGALMGTACRAVAAPGRETATCSNGAACDVGYTCVDGTCHQYCAADVDCPAPRGQCVVDLYMFGQPIVGAPSVCSSNCDPASTIVPECPPGYGCTLWTGLHAGANVPWARCQAAGTGTQGADCKTGGGPVQSLCAPGYECVTFDGGSTYGCRRICSDPGNATSSQCGGQACNPFVPPFTLVGVSYGTCSP